MLFALLFLFQWNCAVTKSKHITIHIFILYQHGVPILQDLSVAQEFLTHLTHLGCSYAFQCQQWGKRTFFLSFFQYRVLTSVFVLVGGNVSLQCSHLLWQQSLLMLVHRSPIWLEAWNCQA